MKKIIIAVSVVLIITVIACAAVISYHNKYYSIQVCVGRPVKDGNGNSVTCKALRNDGESYFCMPMFAGFDDNTPKKNIENMKIATDGINEVFKRVTESYDTHFIESKYEINTKKGITTIAFKGEVVDNETGEMMPFEETLNYGFIITKAIENIPPSESYYFDE